MKLKVSFIVLTCLAFVTCGATVVFAAPPTDACSLLTPAQVSAVLGVSVGAGEKLVPTSPSLCGWEVPGQNGVSRKRVVLNIYTQLGRMSPIQRFNNAKTPIKGITKVLASGIGDDAIFATTPGFGTGLIFREGDAAFDLRVYGFPVDQIKAKEKTLALDVLAKL